MTRKAGTSTAACAKPARVPRHYLRRLAFHLATRTALRRAELVAADRVSCGGAA